MVEVKPFQAWRYNTACVSLEKVIAPPYDVINAEEQDRLYGKSPCNVVRLILGKDNEDEGMCQKDKYSRAAAYLAKWQKDRVLIKDKEPAFYLYRQTYAHPDTKKEVQRVGIFALLKLEDFSSRSVLPHERTHAAPKVDRMHLIEAVGGNLSPVFGLYEDRKHELDLIFEKSMQQKPAVGFKDDEGMSHEIWMIHEKKSVEIISAFFKTQSVMIADGHHRYETALAYSKMVRSKRISIPDGANECESRSNTQHGSEIAIGGRVEYNGALSSDCVMIALVNMYDEGLLVFPTHRLLKLKALPPIEKVEQQLAFYFSISGFSVSNPADWEPYLSRDPKGSVVLGLQWGKSKARLLLLRDEKALRSVMPSGKPDAWYRLDVNIVSHLIIQKILGIAPDKLEEVVSYTRYLDEAVQSVQNGKASVAVILRAPDVAIVKEVCHSGEVMPQKSTYFYPKLPSGLLFHLHERGV